ncbi:MAG: TolC family protein [Bacteroidetes bacterium]|nr:TolC family protein [Bacteroidota bacterium]
MNLNLKNIFFLVYLFSAFSSFAQEKRIISLEEAIQTGIQYSRKLKISEAKISEANAMVTEAKNRQLPDFKISGSYLRLSSANIDLKNSGGSSPESFPGVSSALFGIGNASLPLYAGGKIRFGITSAKYLLEASRLENANDSNAIAFNIIEAYINLYKSREAIKIVQENLQAARSRDTIFSNLEKNGLLARNDLLKSELQTTQTELALLDAENDSKIANVNMDLILGFPESAIIETEIDFLKDIPDVPSFNEVEQQAIQQRKDLQASSLRIQSAQLGIKSAEADKLPTIAITGGYIAAVIPHLLSVTNAVNIGLGVQYNLANLWKSNSGLTRAKAQLAEANAAGELLMDQIKLQSNRDYQDFILSKNKIEVYEKALAQAQENYRITNNKYLNNLATLTDLLEANASLFQAKLNVPFAKADSYMAYKKLMMTTGSIHGN